MQTQQKQMHIVPRQKRKRILKVLHSLNPAHNERCNFVSFLRYVGATENEIFELINKENRRTNFSAKKTNIIFTNNISTRRGEKINYISHKPIRIDGNDGFIAENGVVSGDGSKENPYIIEGWDIDATEQHGIQIIYTDAYFVIRNCCVHDGFYGDVDGFVVLNDNFGICFYNVKNGKIENCKIKNTHGGVYLSRSSNNDITSNKIYSNEYDGIYLDYSSNNNITNNEVYNNWNGVFLSFSSNNNITNNKIYSNDYYGIALQSSPNNNIIENDNIIQNNKFSKKEVRDFQTLIN